MLLSSQALVKDCLEQLSSQDVAKLVLGFLWADHGASIFLAAGGQLFMGETPVMPFSQWVTV